ncbi:MAG: FAD-dependent oxidoreductase [Cyanobacteria bacterium P01_F01_bin.150]
MVYDWIVIGNGITGAAVSYELARLGLSVLLLEQDKYPNSATRHSYGGIAYWSGTTPLMKQICREGIKRHRQLSDELGYSTQLRELDLLLAVPIDLDPASMALDYADCDIQPQPISRDQAIEMEPLLNKDAIAAAFTVSHGHVDPVETVRAYNHGFIQANGTLRIQKVTGFLRSGDTAKAQAIQHITGVTTATKSFHCQNVVVCTGGWTRHFLHAAGIPFHQCFTHAESVELSIPEDESDRIQLNTIVTTANLQRFALEHRGGNTSRCDEWNQPDQELTPYILDAGAIQFANGQIRIGQISRVLTNPSVRIDATNSEQEIRTQVGQLLPILQNQPGEWCHCLVAFSGDGLPLIGPIPKMSGIYLFSGFGNPFSLVPPLAQRFVQQFAQQAAQPDPQNNHKSDPLLDAMNPERFLR